MLTLIVEFDLIAAGFEAADAVDIFTNLNPAGNVPVSPSWGETSWGTYVWGDTGVDESQPANDSPLLLFPGIPPSPSWGESEWGEALWGSSVPVIGASWGVDYWGEGSWCEAVEDAAVVFETKPTHFGRVKAGAKSRDALGNYQSGSVAVAELVVNSAPLPPTRFARSTYSAGQQTFSFRQSAQLREE